MKSEVLELFGGFFILILISEIVSTRAKDITLIMKSSPNFDL